MNKIKLIVKPLTPSSDGDNAKNILEGFKYLISKPLLKKKPLFFKKTLFNF